MSKPTHTISVPDQNISQRDVVQKGTKRKNNRLKKPDRMLVNGRYRNQKCPCGSGKKYKKCCGRNV